MFTHSLHGDGRLQATARTGRLLALRPRSLSRTDEDVSRRRSWGKRKNSRRRKFNYKNIWGVWAFCWLVFSVTVHPPEKKKQPDTDQNALGFVLLLSPPPPDTHQVAERHSGKQNLSRQITPPPSSSPLPPHASPPHWAPPRPPAVASSWWPPSCRPSPSRRRHRPEPESEGSESGGVSEGAEGWNPARDNRMERTKRGIKREIKRCSKYVN